MFGKKPKKEFKIVNTNIWTCDSSDCNGWMREEFSLDLSPTCPICENNMTFSSKDLPQIDRNHNPFERKK